MLAHSVRFFFSCYSSSNMVQYLGELGRLCDGADHRIAIAYWFKGGVINTHRGAWFGFASAT